MPLTHRLTPYPHWELEDPISGDQLRLVPERGGLLSGWRCSGRELIYLDEERFADPALSVRGGMPVLFPICGNLPGDCLPLPDGDYSLKQHGFARDLPWQLEGTPDGRGVRLTLEDTPASLASFPFPFSLELSFQLEAAALAITVRIENRGEVAMPYSFGLHPYFRVSSLDAEAAQLAVRLEGLPDHCLNHLTMTEEATQNQLERLPQGVDLLARPLGAVRLVDPVAGLALELQPSTPLDLVVIWTDPPRPMLCLEPWTGPRGALVSGDRRLEVPAGGAHSLACRYGLTLL
ncbi:MULTISPECIES: galactose mutarotase [unclassified Synechococcus]|uniref:aldose epimerase family protein n=1 Tax=unclassified Synechococcus TaxID=2626047 RepID=UPI0021A8F611|nr:MULTISPECIES: galactose mutarotase [unclassified Synechococcus]MCT0212013.1 galactose mutarotase [Synechococcus sp. CS-1326]MCT0232423.1 galactose mutarotase [Synechococcus sp. CS-1327]